MKKIEVSPAESMPWGYGVAYKAVNKMVYVCYPIPLNLIIRWGRELHYILMRGICRTKSEQQEEKMRQKGWDDGWRAGYSAGEVRHLERINRIERKLEKFIEKET